MLKEVNSIAVCIASLSVRLERLLIHQWCPVVYLATTNQYCAQLWDLLT